MPRYHQGRWSVGTHFDGLRQFQVRIKRAGNFTLSRCAGPSGSYQLCDIRVDVAISICGSRN